MLKVNEIAPSFSTVNELNESVNLDDFKGKQHVVLYFYPKDDTPGCTIQGNQFTALVDEYAAANTVILGVSKDSCESHQAFIKKFDYKISLLADTSGELCEAYDVWQERERNGEKSMGIVRSTFVINKQGILEYVEYAVTPDGHAQQILEFVKNLK